LDYTFKQCELIYSNEDLLRVKARAGTGKTTFLEAFTAERPMNTFLYLSYNKGIKESSRKKFGPNTEVHTISSLAWKHIGKDYKHKLIDNLRIQDILLYLNLDRENQDNFLTAQSIREVLISFFNSDKKEIEFMDEKIQEYSNKIFKNMLDVKNTKVKITHDAYTKQFELMSLDLGYNYVLVDEAQDINLVSKSIIDAQVNSKKIYVGDDFQSIYGYRNTISLLDGAEHTLNETFRFGEEISSFVTKFIKNFLDKDEELISYSKIGKINDNSDKYTLVTRTNAYLFDKSVELVQLNKNIHIIGSSIVFNELLDGMNLYKGDLYKIKNPYIKGFHTFENMKKAVEKINDAELKFLVKIVDKYKENIEFFIKKIEANSVKERYAEITLTTTHKAKGLEFFNVKIGDDFTSLFDNNGNIRRNIDREELNIYYVAITRAIENLILNKDLNRLFK
jgi:hypothetical protein